MGSLFATLGNSANSLDVFEKAIGVVQNNVANASTPGYVTQTLNLTADPFNATENLFGGVSATGVQSARDVFAEQSVWSANQQAGLATQQASSLSSLQNNFDVSGTATGIPAALSSLYAAFSSWSSNPTTAANQQQVISAAQNVTQSVNATAANVTQLSSQTDQQLSSTVTQINQYSTQIAAINGEIRQGGSGDAGLQTQLYNTLEQLSNLAPITVQTESDGTSTVLLGGQSPLVIGQTANALSISYTPPTAPPAVLYPGATPDATLSSADGHDVTALATQGTLGGLLQFRNTTLPALIGDPQQQGSLNVLAQGIADNVNNLLTSGQQSSGAAGIPLFSYAGNPASSTSVASSLVVNPAISASTLAAIQSGPPVVANGVASQLANPQAAGNEINGASYTDVYSSIASGIGTQEASAASDETTQTQLLTQAQSMRAQVSGVSLNDQAAQLLQYQEAYQAAAQVVTTINNMVQSLLTAVQNP